MKQQKKETKADKIRALLAQGMKPGDIAATVDCMVQAVYDVQYRDRKSVGKVIVRSNRKKTLASVRISNRTGKPVRKYKKRKQSLAQRGAELRRMVEERKQEAQRSEPPKVGYIEIEVPQPHYNLTWGQRFKALFTGRV